MIEPTDFPSSQLNGTGVGPDSENFRSLTGRHFNSLYLFRQFGRILAFDRVSGLPYPFSQKTLEVLWALRQGDPSGSSSAVQQALEELAAWKAVGHLSGEEPQPATEDLLLPELGTVFLNLTHACNLTCPYCVMHLPGLEDKYEKNLTPMSLETAQKALDLIVRTAPQGITITFFGGEPLLAFGLLQDIVEYAESHYPGWFDYQLITNGTLLEPGMFDFIKEHDIRVLVSFDGPPAEHDALRKFRRGPGSTFQETWRRFQALLAAWPQCRYQVNATYLRGSLKVAKTVDFFLRQGVAHLRVDRGLVPRKSPFALTMAEVDRLKEEFDRLILGYRDYFLRGQVYRVDPFAQLISRLARGRRRWRACNAGVDYLTVAPDGEIYSCFKLLGLPALRLGHVNHGLDNRVFAEVWSRHVGQRRPCSSCWARYFCGGGCVADNFHLTGDFFQPSPESCAIFKHQVRLALWLFRELEDQAPAALKQLVGDAYLLPQDIPVKSKEVREEPDGLTLRHRRTNAVYRLNQVAAEIWHACDGRLTLSELSASLAATYGLPQTLALFDVRFQVSRFLESGLMEVSLQKTPN
uniref:SPASM domain-containing protein n=1 Tax=Desulfobacca acetoxidans TaxID=60893 RepID=A0A7C5AM79_9BACT